MTGPMEGIRVVDLGVWVAGPATAAILADWGADVIKIEPPSSDPARGMVQIPPHGINPTFELDNRGKRSIGVDLDQEAGRALVHELVARADVVVTNHQQTRLAPWGFDHASLAERYPRLVYASLNGFGTAGPEKDRRTYDVGGWWARSGLAGSHTVDGEAPPVLRGAVGDHMTAAILAGGIAAALLERTRTGKGQRVSTSLLRSGFYALGTDANVALRAGFTLPMGQSRETTSNPLMSPYRAGDGKWFWILGLQPDRHWPGVARAVGRPELIDDPRFATSPARREHVSELVGLLDEVFATATRDEWGAALEAEGVFWEPVRTLMEAIEDPQLREAGAIVDDAPVLEGAGSTVASPVDFGGVPTGVPERPSPEFAQHSEEILLELGHDWDDIARLKDAGVIV